MVSDDFISLLRCVHTSTRLQVVDDDFCAEVNAQIQQRQVFDALGRAVERPVDALLVNEGFSFGYAVYDHVPHLLRDEAIVLEGVPRE